MNRLACWGWFSIEYSLGGHDYKLTGKSKLFCNAITRSPICRERPDIGMKFMRQTVRNNFKIVRINGLRREICHCFYGSVISLDKVPTNFAYLAI